MRQIQALLSLAAASLAIVAGGMQCRESTGHALASATVPTAHYVPNTAGTLDSLNPSDPVQAQAAQDPLDFLYQCRAHHEQRRIGDYACTFTKRERIGGELHEPEVIRVQFRPQPYSVDMQWKRNARSANRALYVQDAWVDSRGRQLGWFKPAGALIKLIVPTTQQPLNSARVRDSSRRSIDQFGFERTLDLVIEYSQLAQQRGDLELRYVGTGEVDGRETFVFERYLPYDGSESTYPDALLRFHIDKQWRVPTALYSYADEQGDVLLGSYLFSDVKFNVGLDDDDFNPDKLGF